MELSTTLVRFYQQQQQQKQLLQQQQQQQQIMHENESCDDEDLNETNRIENSFINENRQLLETIKSSKKDYDVDMFINEMREYPCIWNTSLKSDSHLPKKIYIICFIESHLEMKKNAFYFILKAYFILKIFEFMS